MPQSYLVVGVYYPQNSTHHKHITRIRIYKPEDEKFYYVLTDDAVRQIENKDRIYFVHEGGECTNLNVVSPSKGDKYLRTNGDDSKKDNLMNLPRNGE
jgi:hypothetical protein